MLRPRLGVGDWAYLLALLLPLLVHNLALKAEIVFSGEEALGLFGALGLMRSHTLFNLGYVVLWIGLFAVLRRGSRRRKGAISRGGDTIFVLYGDHGEAFAEHGIRGHDNVSYEEGLRISLMIHDPGRPQGGERVEGTPSNLLDVAPTLVDMLGYRVEGGEYPGSTLLEPLPEGRPLNFNCRPDQTCAARIESYEKYIHHYGDEPEEFYDLRDDPREQDNIVDQQSEEKLARMREELLQWRLEAAGLYNNASAGESGGREGV